MIVNVWSKHSCIKQVLLFITLNILTIRMLIIILLALFAVKSSAYLSHSCFTGCQTCQITFFFEYCLECSLGRNYNLASGICDCPFNTYDDGQDCITCPIQCATCNYFGCTSCSDDKSYDGISTCLCRNGKSMDSNGVCEQDDGINLGKIVGISFGVALGLSCVFIIVYYLRNRSDRAEMEANQIYIFRKNHIRPGVINYEMQENSSYGIVIESKFTEQFKEEICSICLDVNPYFMTECGHYFHQHCIDQWIKKKSSCPNCNSQISRQKIVKWCNKCKRQPLYPQIFRLQSYMNGSGSDIPIYWAYCRVCDVPQQLIEMK